MARFRSADWRPARPAYQQNDYIGWIDRTKLECTRRRRLAEMMASCGRGGVYMKMRWRPRGVGK